MSISYWSSDVCSSDLGGSAVACRIRDWRCHEPKQTPLHSTKALRPRRAGRCGNRVDEQRGQGAHISARRRENRLRRVGGGSVRSGRSEEHTSELQSLMRISYAVFCLKKNKIHY